MLCLAFQMSEGPYETKVSYMDHDEWLKLSREEIENLSDLTDIRQIDICNPSKERRWMDRLTFDRRTQTIPRNTK
jgi:hypothetical protein